jgi:hypothetical protein
MGEAVYSIIAEFPEPVSDAKAKALKEFFLEGARAEDYWQEHRDLSKKFFQVIHLIYMLLYCVG